jgi:hypothetical protein
MDMPPTGWYPDPYGVPGLLRWWDGTAWTAHIQADPAAPQGGGSGGSAASAGSGASGGSGGSGPATSTDLPPVASGEPATSTDPRPATSLDIPPATSTDLPRATSLDIPPATSADVHPAAHASGTPGSGQRTDSDTRVMYIDSSQWGPEARSPGSGPASDYDFGKYDDGRRKRRRRGWLMALLAVGTAAVLAVLALVVVHFGKQPGQKPAALSSTHPVTHHTAAPTPSASSASPSASASPTTTGSQVTDTASKLSYALLGAPWQATCPGALNGQVFSWTAGESAVAGQISANGQAANWYGNACSGPLPQQYGYNGVADLEPTAANLVNAFDPAYYSSLQHTRTQVESQPLQVSGHAAWEIKFLMTYPAAASQGLAWNTEMGAVVVVDTGAGQAPSVFYASVPSNLGMGNVDTLVSSLQLSGQTPQVTPSAAAGTPPAPNPTGSVNP